jgi:arylsulfatase A-like enzyme
VVDHPVIQLDIAATALAAAGVKAEGAPLDGVDILPALAGKADSPPHERLYWRFGQQKALRQGNYKLVRGPGPQANTELFDLGLDPAEKNDLTASKPELAKELTAAWDKWNGELVAPKWAPQRAAGAAAKKKRRAAQD